MTLNEFIEESCIAEFLNDNESKLCSRLMRLAAKATIKVLKPSVNDNFCKCAYCSDFDRKVKKWLGKK